MPAVGNPHSRAQLYYSTPLAGWDWTGRQLAGLSPADLVRVAAFRQSRGNQAIAPGDERIELPDDTGHVGRRRFTGDWFHTHACRDPVRQSVGLCDDVGRAVAAIGRTPEDR